MDLTLLFLLFSAFFLLGDKIRAWRRLIFSGSAEALVICAALGLVATSCVTTWLAFLGLIYPATGWAFLGFIYLTSLRKLSQFAREFYSEVKTIFSASPMKSLEWFDWFNLGVLCVLLFCALTLAQTPPTRTDALIYHLAVPKAYLEHHGVVNLPNNVASFLPAQMEMVYLFCLMIGGEGLAKLAGLGMAVLLLLALTLFYKRNLSARHLTLVPVLFFSTPTFFELSTTAYVDLAVAGFIFLAYYAWYRWQTEESWLFLLIIFTGAAAATKLTAVIFVPVALIGILRQNSGNALKPALLLIFGVLAFMLPWWARNYYYSGNPFVPLFMQVFGGEDKINWDIHRALLMDEFVKSFGMGRGIKEFLLLPIHLTFFSEKDGPRFDGQIGILYFLLLPGLLYLRRGDARKHILRLAVVFGVLLIFWFSRFQYIRFLASPFTFLTLILVYGFGQMTANPSGTGVISGVKRLAPVLAAVAIAYNTSLILADWKSAEPLSYLLKQNREQYLAKHIAVYPMYQTLNRTLDKNDTALLVHMRNLGYLIERKFIGDSLIESHTLRAALDRDASVDGISRQLRVMGVTYLMFDNNYVFGKESAFSPEQREALKNFINARAKLIERKNSFYLYRLVVD